LLIRNNRHSLESSRFAKSLSEDLHQY
jgi:hypothetical protein